MGAARTKRNDIHGQNGEKYVGRYFYLPDTVGGLEEICACRWHMRYKMGVVFKDGPWGKLAELQIDTVALQRGMRMEENAKADCTEEKGIQNERLIRMTDERWEAKRTEEADISKRPQIAYGEWIAIEGRSRNFPLEELEGAVSRWRLWEDTQSEEAEMVE